MVGKGFVKDAGFDRTLKDFSVWIYDRREN